MDSQAQKQCEKQLKTHKTSTNVHFQQDSTTKPAESNMQAQVNTDNSLGVSSPKQQNEQNNGGGSARIGSLRKNKMCSNHSVSIQDEEKITDTKINDGNKTTKSYLSKQIIDFSSATQQLKPSKTQPWQENQEKDFSMLKAKKSKTQKYSTQERLVVDQENSDTEAFNYQKIGVSKTPHRLLLKKHTVKLMKGLFDQHLKSGNSPEKLLKGYDPLPSQHLRSKFKFFYSGYSPAANLHKHMEFDEEAEQKRKVQSYQRMPLKSLYKTKEMELGNFDSLAFEADQVIKEQREAKTPEPEEEKQSQNDEEKQKEEEEKLLLQQQTGIDFNRLNTYQSGLHKKKEMRKASSTSCRRVSQNDVNVDRKKRQDGPHLTSKKTQAVENESAQKECEKYEEPSNRRQEEDNYEYHYDHEGKLTPRSAKIRRKRAMQRLIYLINYIKTIKLRPSTSSWFHIMNFFCNQPKVVKDFVVKQLEERSRSFKVRKVHKKRQRHHSMYNNKSGGKMHNSRHFTKKHISHDTNANQRKQEDDQEGSAVRNIEVKYKNGSADRKKEADGPSYKRIMTNPSEGTKETFSSSSSELSKKSPYNRQKKNQIETEPDSGVMLLLKEISSMNRKRGLTTLDKSKNSPDLLSRSRLNSVSPSNKNSLSPLRKRTMDSNSISPKSRPSSPGLKARAINENTFQQYEEQSKRLQLNIFEIQDAEHATPDLKMQANQEFLDAKLMEQTDVTTNQRTLICDNDKQIDKNKDRQTSTDSKASQKQVHKKIIENINDDFKESECTLTVSNFAKNKTNLASAFSPKSNFTHVHNAFKNQYAKNSSLSRYTSPLDRSKKENDFSLRNAHQKQPSLTTNQTSFRQQSPMNQFQRRRMSNTSSHQGTKSQIQASKQNIINQTQLLSEQNPSHLYQIQSDLEFSDQPKRLLDNYKPEKILSAQQILGSDVVQKNSYLLINSCSETNADIPGILQRSSPAIATTIQDSKEKISDTIDIDAIKSAKTTLKDLKVLSCTSLVDQQGNSNIKIYETPIYKQNSSLVKHKENQQQTFSNTDLREVALSQNQNNLSSQKMQLPNDLVMNETKRFLDYFQIKPKARIQSAILNKKRNQNDPQNPENQKSNQTLTSNPKPIHAVQKVLSSPTTQMSPGQNQTKQQTPHHVAVNSDQSLFQRKRASHQHAKHLINQSTCQVMPKLTYLRPKSPPQQRLRTQTQHQGPLKARSNYCQNGNTIQATASELPLHIDLLSTFSQTPTANTTTANTTQMGRQVQSRSNINNTAGINNQQNIRLGNHKNQFNAGNDSYNPNLRQAAQTVQKDAIFNPILMQQNSSRQQTRCFSGRYQANANGPSSLNNCKNGASASATKVTRFNTPKTQRAVYPGQGVFSINQDPKLKYSTGVLSNANVQLVKNLQ